MMVMEAMASFHTLCDDGRSRDRDDNNDCNASNDNDNCDEELFFLVWSGGFLLTCEGEMVRPYMETHTASP